MTPVEAARLADDAEAIAFRAIFDAAPPPLRDKLGLQVRDVAGATLLVAAAMPTTMFNRVIGLGFERPATEEDVRQAAAVYREAGVKDWWLHWNPLAEPAAMAHMLEAMGFRAPPRRSWAKFLRSSASPPKVDTDLQVHAATDEQLPQVAALAAQAFDMPPFMANWLARQRGGAWRAYALTDGTEVVGGGWMYADPRAAWLGIGAVAPSHRGRGGQAALLARRIADAGAEGIAWVVTETGEPTAAGEANPSLANIRASGFHCVASRLNFAPPAA